MERYVCLSFSAVCYAAVLPQRASFTPSAGRRLGADMTIRWRGKYGFINWDGSAHRGTNQPNMMRTSDGKNLP
jgi:hypothetical protein